MKPFFMANKNYIGMHASRFYVITTYRYWCYYFNLITHNDMSIKLRKVAGARFAEKSGFMQLADVKHAGWCTTGIRYTVI